MKVGATAKSREGSHLFTFTNGLVVRAGTLSELLAFFSTAKMRGSSVGSGRTLFEVRERC